MVGKRPTGFRQGQVREAEGVSFGGNMLCPLKHPPQPLAPGIELQGSQVSENICKTH